MISPCYLVLLQVCYAQCVVSGGANSVVSTYGPTANLIWKSECGMRNEFGELRRAAECGSKGWEDAIEKCKMKSAKGKMAQNGNGCGAICKRHERLESLARNTENSGDFEDDHDERHDRLAESAGDFERIGQAKGGDG